MSTGRRSSRRRRWQRVAVAVASVAILAGGVKAGSMYWFSEAGVRAYDEGRFDDSASSFRRLQTLNIVDPALAFVGTGDAHYRQGDLIAAETSFARALELDRGDCAARFNLAVTIEAQGDRILAREPLVPAEIAPPFDPSAPRRDDPLERYKIALAVADGDPCPSTEAGDVGDRLVATRDRINAKIDALEDDDEEDGSADPVGPENAERGDSEEIKNLELRNRSGARQREQARDRDTTGALPGGQSNW